MAFGKGRMALAASMEAISFQVKELLFSELKIVFEELLKSKSISQDELKKSGLAQIVKKYTGVFIVPNLQENDYDYSACVEFPQIDINHPLVAEAYRHLKGNIDGIAAIKAAKGAIKGSVDFKTSKVSGSFQDFECNMYFSKGLFKSGKFSAGEIAAITLHEIGHVFTYFSFLALNIKVNHVLFAASQAMMNTASQEERFVIMREVENSLDVKLSDKESLGKASKAEVVQTVILNSVIEKTRSELGSNIYDLRAWEALCDQFAARHGAGRDLATALDKIYRHYGASSYRSLFTFTLLEIVKASLFTMMILTGTGIALCVLVLLTNPMERIYDEPGERIKRVRLQLVEALKDKGISDTRRKQLLADIDVVDQLLPEINDRRGILELFWSEVVPYGRRQQSQKETQQALEALLANELFVRAAQFKTMNV